MNVFVTNHVNRRKGTLKVLWREKSIQFGQSFLTRYKHMARRYNGTAASDTHHVLANMQAKL